MHIRGDQEARYEFVGRVVVDLPARRHRQGRLHHRAAAAASRWRGARAHGDAMSAERGRASHDVMVDINTTPLIDVMLVLLVMLIITIPVQTHAVKLDMPQGNPPPRAGAAGGGRSRHRFRRHDHLERRGRCPTAPTLEALSAPAAQQARQPEIHLRAQQAGQVRLRRRRCWPRPSAWASSRSAWSATSSSCNDRSRRIGNAFCEHRVRAAVGGAAVPVRRARWRARVAAEEKLTAREQVGKPVRAAEQLLKAEEIPGGAGEAAGSRCGCRQDAL